MTKKQQVKKDAPKAVELNEAALDRVAGGALVAGDAIVGGPPARKITDGTSNT